MKKSSRSHQRPWADEEGQSLVQVLVSAGLMGVLMMSMVSMFQVQQREAAALGQKLAQMEFEKRMIATLADGSVCSKLAVGQAFNAASITDAITSAVSPVTLNLGSELPATSAVGAPWIAKVGEPVSPASNALVVSSIELTNFRGSPAGSQFTADLRVNWDNSRLVRPIQPAVVQETILTTGLGVGKTISSCLGTGIGLSPQQICQDLLGFTYNAATNPPCIQTTMTTAQQQAFCGLIGGTWTGVCTLNILACDGSMISWLLLAGNNLKKTLDAMLAFASANGGATSVAIWREVDSILASKSPEEAVNKIYSLAGVEAADRREVVRFLEEKDFAHSRYARIASVKLDIESERAADLLGEISKSMRGN